MPRDQAPEEDHEGEGAGKASGTVQEAWCVLKRGAGGEEVSIRESEGTGGQSQGEQLVGAGKRSISSALYLCSRCTGGSMSSEGDR